MGIKSGVLTVAFLLISGVANAAFQWNPPARYDHPYPGKSSYIYGKRNYPWQCWNAYACTYPGKVCTLYMPYRDEVIAGVKFDLTNWRSLLRHERGHCNGWPPNHPAY